MGSSRMASTEKRYLQFIIADQIQRINYIISQRGTNSEDDSIFYSRINSSVKALEAIVSPILPQKYFIASLQFKKDCDKNEDLLFEQYTLRWNKAFAPIMDWYSLLIIELRKLNMIPLEETDVYSPDVVDFENTVSVKEENDLDEE